MISFTSRGWSDYTSWSGERKTLLRVNRLIEESLRDPATGIGKPERLSGDLSGHWSRRIDQEHRLVYRHTDAGVIVIACRYHY